MSGKLKSKLKKLTVDLKTLRAENRKLRRQVCDLENELDYLRGGRLVGSATRKTFHRQDCRWAEFIINSENLIEFSSHEEAVDAGYRPCKTCCA